MAGQPVAITFFTEPNDGCCVGNVRIVPWMRGSSFDVGVGHGAPPPVSWSVFAGWEPAA